MELLWLKNRELGNSITDLVGSGLFVHVVGHIEQQCGRITQEEADMVSSWCAAHEEKNTV